MEVWEVVVRGQCSEFTVSEALQFQGAYVSGVEESVSREKTSGC